MSFTEYSERYHHMQANSALNTSVMFCFILCTTQMFKGIKERKVSTVDDKDSCNG